MGYTTRLLRVILTLLCLKNCSAASVGGFQNVSTGDSGSFSFEELLKTISVPSDVSGSASYPISHHSSKTSMYSDSVKTESGTANYSTKTGGSISGYASDTKSPLYGSNAEMSSLLASAPDVPLELMQPQTGTYSFNPLQWQTSKSMAMPSSNHPAQDGYQTGVKSSGQSINKGGPPQKLTSKLFSSSRTMDKPVSQPKYPHLSSFDPSTSQFSQTDSLFAFPISAMSASRLHHQQTPVQSVFHPSSQQPVQSRYVMFDSKQVAQASDQSKVLSSSPQASSNTLHKFGPVAVHESSIHSFVQTNNPIVNNPYQPSQLFEPGSGYLLGQRFNQQPVNSNFDAMTPMKPVIQSVSQYAGQKIVQPHYVSMNLLQNKQPQTSGPQTVPAKYSAVSLLGNQKLPQVIASPVSPFISRKPVPTNNAQSRYSGQFPQGNLASLHPSSQQQLHTSQDATSRLNSQQQKLNLLSLFQSSSQSKDGYPVLFSSQHTPEASSSSFLPSSHQPLLQTNYDVATLLASHQLKTASGQSVVPVQDGYRPMVFFANQHEHDAPLVQPGSHQPVLSSHAMSLLTGKQWQETDHVEVQSTSPMPLKSDDPVLFTSQQLPQASNPSMVNSSSQQLEQAHYDFMTLLGNLQPQQASSPHVVYDSNQKPGHDYDATLFSGPQARDFSLAQTSDEMSLLNSNQAEVQPSSQMHDADSPLLLVKQQPPQASGQQSSVQPLKDHDVLSMFSNADEIDQTLVQHGQNYSTPQLSSQQQPQAGDPSLLQYWQPTQESYVTDAFVYQEEHQVNPSQTKTSDHLTSFDPMSLLSSQRVAQASIFSSDQFDGHKSMLDNFPPSMYSGIQPPDLSGFSGPGHQQQVQASYDAILLPESYQQSQVTPSVVPPNGEEHTIDQSAMHTSDMSVPVADSVVSKVLNPSQSSYPIFRLSKPQSSLANSAQPAKSNDQSVAQQISLKPLQVKGTSLPHSSGSAFFGSLQSQRGQLYQIGRKYFSCFESDAPNYPHLALQEPSTPQPPISSSLSIEQYDNEHVVQSGHQSPVTTIQPSNDSDGVASGHRPLKALQSVLSTSQFAPSNFGLQNLPKRPSNQPLVSPSYQFPAHPGQSSFLFRNPPHVNHQAMSSSQRPSFQFLDVYSQSEPLQPNYKPASQLTPSNSGSQMLPSHHSSSSAKLLSRYPFASQNAAVPPWNNQNVNFRLWNK